MENNHNEHEWSLFTYNLFNIICDLGHGTLHTCRSNELQEDRTLIERIKLHNSWLYKPGQETEFSFC